MTYFSTLGVCDGIAIVWPTYQQVDMKCHTFTCFIFLKETLFHTTFDLVADRLTICWLIFVNPFFL